MKFARGAANFCRRCRLFDTLKRMAFGRVFLFLLLLFRAPIALAATECRAPGADKNADRLIPVRDSAKSAMLLLDQVKDFCDSNQQAGDEITVGKLSDQLMTAFENIRGDKLQEFFKMDPMVQARLDLLNKWCVIDSLPRNTSGNCAALWKGIRLNSETSILGIQHFLSRLTPNPAPKPSPISGSGEQSPVDPIAPTHSQLTADRLKQGNMAGITAVRFV